MNKPITLIEFLESTGTSVSIYDIGRRVSKITRKDFLKFEKLEIPYPYPIQQQAWFALSILDKKVSNEPVFWFLHFPLDETGKLQQASRDYFIQRLFEAATASTQQDNANLSTDALKDNPHVFKPRADKMAVFHARLGSLCHRPASRFYLHARQYLSGSQGWEQWNFIGFQGIADLVERIADDNNEKLVLQAIPHLPQQPLEALCQCLENIVTSLPIAQVILQRCERELDAVTPSPSVIAHLIRGISLTSSVSVKNRLLKGVMKKPVASHPLIVGAVAARCWEWLVNDGHAKLYLEQLANSDQQSFNNCLTDLLFMPGLRNILLGVIRNPERPDRLAQAFNRMINSQR